MKKTKIFSISLFLSFILFFSPVSVWADSSSISIDGQIYDVSSGEPVDGVKSVTVKIYADCDDDEALETETSDVTFTDGFYNIPVEIDTELASEHDGLCVGVQIEDDSEMTPRLEYFASPYSMKAASADVATVAMGLDSSALSEIISEISGSGLTASGDTLTLDTSSAKNWSGTQTYTAQVILSQDAADTSSSSAPFYLNSANSVANGKLIAIQDNGVDRFNIDKEGDVSIGGNLSVTGTITPSALIAAGSTNISSTELSYLDGVTSNIQTQLNSAGTGDITSVVAGNGLTGGAASADATLDIGAGSGISVAADAVTLGVLTGDWNQTGAFDISLNNAASELKILESAGGAFYGIFDITDLNADRTYTFPDASGTVALTTSNVATATALAANGGNCAAGQYPLGVDASGAVESCTADDDAPENDSEVPDNITINSTNLTQTFTLGASDSFFVDGGSTAHTETTNGVMNLRMNAGAVGVNGVYINATTNNGLASGTAINGINLSLTGNDADADFYGMRIISRATANASTGTYVSGLSIDNEENSSGAMSDGILITSSGQDGGITDGLDVSDSNLTYSVNVGANPITGTSIAISPSSNMDINVADNNSNSFRILESGFGEYLKVDSTNNSERLYLGNNGGTHKTIFMSTEVSPNSANTTDLGSTGNEYGNIYLGDDKGVQLGLDQNASLLYDETTDDRIELSGTNASLWIEDKLSLGKQSFDFATVGAGTENLTVTSSYVAASGADDNADIMQIQTTGAKTGDILIIVNTGANSFNVDQNATTKLDGGADVTLTQWDSILLIWEGTSWIQIGQVSANS